MEEGFVNEYVLDHTFYIPPSTIVPTSSHMAVHLKADISDLCCPSSPIWVLAVYEGWTAPPFRNNTTPPCFLVSVPFSYNNLCKDRWQRKVRLGKPEGSLKDWSGKDWAIRVSQYLSNPSDPSSALPSSKAELWDLKKETGRPHPAKGAIQLFTPASRTRRVGVLPSSPHHLPVEA